MKISYNWLKQYVNCDYSAEKVSELLTSTALKWKTSSVLSR